MPDVSFHADDSTSGGHARRTRLARNSVWNTIGWAGVLVMTIGTLPWFLRLLGETQYGLLALVMSIVAPLGVLDFGMSDATIKYLAESVGRNDMDAAKKYAHGNLAFSMLVGVFGAVAIVVAARPLVIDLFKIPQEHQAVAITSMRWVGVLWCFMQLRQTIMGVYMALQRYDLLAGGTVLTQGSVIGAGLWTLFAGGNLAEMLRAQAVVAALYAGILAAVAWWIFPPIRLPVRVDLRSLRKTFGFGFWQMVNTLGGLLSYQSQRWLLGILLPVRTVGHYNISAQVVNIAYMASYKVGQVLFPEVSRMQGRGDEAGAARLAVNASWLLTTLSAMLFVPLVVFAHDLLRLYLGLSMAENSTAVLRILAIGTAVGCTFAIPSFYLLGTGRSQWLAAMSLVYGVITFGACLLLIPRLGITGAGWGMSTATIAHVGMLWLLWRSVLKAWIPGRTYAASVFGPLVLAGLLATSLIAWRDSLDWQPGWFGLIAGAAVVSVAAVAVLLTADLLLPGGRVRNELLRKVVGSITTAIRSRLGRA